MQRSPDVKLLDLSSPARDVAAEVLEGLRASPKVLPPKLFYDERGSALFEAICELPEYYLTRTEIGILERNLGEIASALGPAVQLIEPGSGAGTKTRILLAGLEDPVSYVPIDISCEHLLDAARGLARAFPALEVQPVCADFGQPLEVPQPARKPRRRVAFFPGSSIGNFSPTEAAAFLDHLGALVGPGGGLLIGFDLRKDESRLVAAYDDAQGITAEFNRNMLVNLNRTAGADFQPERFAHEATWNAAKSRIEMRLVSSMAQEVHIGGRAVAFADGEGILTECCHKYGPGGMADLTDRFEVRTTWFGAATGFDGERSFGVQYLEVPETSV